MDGIILINKPQGMTSHDVVNRVRRIMHTKKVGHCGTLDPMATGVLVVGINKATKAMQFLMSEEKEYRATLKLGSATDTYDSEGEVLETKPFIGYENLEDVLASFVGDSMAATRSDWQDTSFSNRLRTSRALPKFSSRLS